MTPAYQVSPFQGSSEASIELSVVSCVVLKENRVLLLRKNRLGGHPARGQWAIPGGKLHSAELPSDGMAREMAEEIGWRIETNSLRLLQDYLVRHPLATYRLYVFELITPPQSWDVTLSHEHEDSAWISLQEIQKIDLMDVQSEILDQFRNQKDKDKEVS